MYSNSNKFIGQSLFRIATVYLFYKFLSNGLKVFWNWTRYTDISNSLVDTKKNRKETNILGG